MKPEKAIELNDDIIKQFAEFAYYRPYWGALNVVLSGGNYDNESVEVCLNFALSSGDVAAIPLAEMLKLMTYTQRKKVADKAFDWNEQYSATNTWCAPEVVDSHG